MKKVLKILDHIEEIVLVPAFAMMLIINFGNVLVRKLFHGSWAFTEELCLVAFVYVTFFGASLAVRQRQHLGFDLLYNKVPPIVKLVFDTLTLLIVLGIVYVMVHYGIKVMENQAKYNSKTPALYIPMQYCSASIPIGGACIGIRTIQNYIIDVKAFIKNKKDAKGGQK